ncbi:MAG: transposase [Deltaproteobacteria bacterium]|nr:transposase [Deltaproteobacteria bacterium]
MAHGSSKGFRAYVNKVFEIERALAGLSDGRREPTVPMAAIVTTWLWAFMRRLPSTEQVGQMLTDRRWRRRLGLRDADGGSADTAARALDELVVEEINALCLAVFFIARRAGLLDGGPFGQRCVLVDLNELFTSESVHCDHCQVREKRVVRNGREEVVNEYYHQAVALVWVGGDMAWPIGWELLAPGEGELPAALRLLDRLLPALRQSVDLVMGDGLYCCRPFFERVVRFSINGLAISSGQTEMDEEIELLKRSGPGRVTTAKVEVWEYESEAWAKDVGTKLRVVHYERCYAAKAYRHERSQLRIVTTAPAEMVPAGQGWQLGRSRWKIENGTFNIFTRDYSLTHNYHHSTTAIAALLVFRSLAYVLTWAYRRYATARSKAAPSSLLRWFNDVMVEDWVRYLDAADVVPSPSG